MATTVTRSEPMEPMLPPVSERPTLVGWLRRNLFSSPVNSVISILLILLLLWIIVPFVRWAFVDATWLADSREGCTAGGACWAVFRVRWRQYLYGLYPEPEQWRINLAVVLLIAAFLPLFLKSFGPKLWWALGMIVVYPIVAWILFMGGMFGLPLVETSMWGGLFLTLVIAITGIVSSLPLGIVLALGRRSKLPIIKSLSVAFIELVRGVPLVTVLFMASVMLPLFLPEGVTFDKLLRALIAVMLFSSAYIAEVVRGGLQALPKGQSEAAAALGLGYWQTTGLIVLPQALKLVIPGIVNSFIGLFKDTSLVLIVGLFDLLGMAQLIIKDPKWLGLAPETYVIAGLGFWIFCFGMSRYSQHLERKLQTGHKR
ncbi:MAG: amino acid ABC transporter permease [Geminicoccaceae bacterium]